MPTDLHAYGFHTRYAPATWQAHVCAEFVPLLQAALAEDGAAIAGLGMVDTKMPHLIVVLDRPAGTAMTARMLQSCAEGARLRQVTGAIVCDEHYSSIEWDEPGAQSPLAEQGAGAFAAESPAPARSRWARMRAWLRGG